jgi:hypothetical protein
MQGNFSLLALAILLIELCRGESFEKQQRKQAVRAQKTRGTHNSADAEDEAVARLLTLSKASKGVNDVQDELSEEANLAELYRNGLFCLSWRNCTLSWDQAEWVHWRLGWETALGKKLITKLKLTLNLPDRTEMKMD